ncbi:MAG: hypothetical protein QOK07_2665, partial [Gemmatimonadaceae bacterium]|nr:hypothetical protein [Gemmatimonadaceae bacterium]
CVRHWRDIGRRWPERGRNGRSRGIDFLGTIGGKQQWWCDEEGDKKLLWRQEVRGKGFKSPQIGKLGSEEEGREGEWQEGWGPESRDSEGRSEEILSVRRDLQGARTQRRRQEGRVKGSLSKVGFFSPVRSATSAVTL